MAKINLISVAGIGLGLAMAAGCGTNRGGTYQGFDSAEPDLGTIPQGENPMPAAVAPVQGGEVIYPDPQPTKLPEYWQEHSDPYAGLTAPAAQPAPAQTAGYGTYVVQKGDTFGGIAQKNHVSLKSLKAANPGINYDKIRIGQKLSIPAASAKSAAAAAPAQPGVYVVQKGDILGRIARQHGVKLADLKAANNLTGDKIVVGQKLVIPGKGASAKAPAPAPASVKPQAAEPKAEPKAVTARPIEVTPPSFDDFAAPQAQPAPAEPDVNEAPSFGVSAADPAEPAKTTYIANGNEDLYSIAISHTMGVNEISRLNPDLAATPNAKLPAGTKVTVLAK